MFAETIKRAIMAASRMELPTLAGQVWKSFAAGLVTDVEASELAELVDARKVIPVKLPVPRRVGSRPTTPASLQRRRRWMAAGMLPPGIACQFTPAETAVLAMIAAEIVKRGQCRLPIGAIAALAGVSKTSVRNALSAAKAAGLINVRERRLSRWRNLTNVVTIVSREWLTWLTIGAAGGGRKLVERTHNKNITRFTPFHDQQRQTSYEQQKVAQKRAEDRRHSLKATAEASHPRTQGAIAARPT